LTPNELVLTFGGLYFCVKFGENRQRNATVRVMTHGQTDRHTDRQTQTDFIICPIAQIKTANINVKTEFIYKCYTFTHRKLQKLEL